MTKITIDKAVVKQALEALQESTPTFGWKQEEHDRHTAVMNKLRAAIAQAEPSSVTMHVPEADAKHMKPPTFMGEPVVTAKPETQGAREELIRLLLEDAAHHREVASDCDCRPEDTVNWQHALRCEQAAALLAAGPAIPAPHECKTEAERTAYAFGWWKALEHARAAAGTAHVEPLTEDRKNED